MVDTRLRKIKDSIYSPIINWFTKIHPNAISIAALITGLVSAGCVLLADLLLAGLVFWLFSRVLDGLDGAVARAHGKQSELGAYLDIMTDFSVYLAIPIAFALRIGTLGVWAAACVLIGSFYINTASWMYLSILLEKKKYKKAESYLTSVNMPVGLIEGAETIIFYSLFFILPQYIIPIFAVMAVLTFVSVLQRVISAIKTLR